MLLEFAASLLPYIEAFAAPKGQTPVILITKPLKQMNSKDLSSRSLVEGKTTVEIAAKTEVQHNAYSMHAGTKTAPNAKPMAGFWPPWAWCER